MIAEVREYPVFVPHREGHLAAVLTIPMGPPRGLVALLTGIGTGRAHRFQVWARTARALAAHDIASVRLDWDGIGDSSGVVDAWSWSQEQDLLDQATVALRTAARVIGSPPTAVVGNCFGARVALRLGADEPGCIGSACILLPITGGAPERMLRRASRARVLGLLRRNRWVRRMVVRRVRERRGMDETARRCVEKTLSRGRLLLLYGHDDHALSDRTRRQMDDLVAGLPAEQVDRYELRVLPVPKMAGFDTLETQRLAIEAIVSWLDLLFPAEPDLEIAADEPGSVATQDTHRRDAGAAS